jgi:Protein of unknown function (DUF2975)
MNDQTAIPQKKLRRLGNILLVVACLGLISWVWIIPLTISLTSPWPTVSVEFDQNFEESQLPAGITPETTVRELMERDRTFFNENRQTIRVLSIVATGFLILISVVFLRLALAWRRAEAFGRITIIGLRCLGVLLIVQFIAGWIVDFFIARPAHGEIFTHSVVSELPVMLLVVGPNVSTGILCLILSWVLDYGRRIKEEQALTI